MDALTSEPNLLACLAAASEVAELATDQAVALRELTEWTRKVLRAQLCTITWADMERRTITIAGCSSPNPELVNRLSGKTSSLGTPQSGAVIFAHLFAQGHIVEKYHLTDDGQGVVSQQLARREGLESVLCHPIKDGGHILGYLSAFKSDVKRFTDEEKNLLGILARFVGGVAERCERGREFKQTLDALQATSKNLLNSPAGFLHEVCANVCSLLGVRVCIIWRCDNKKQILKVAETSASVDEAFRTMTLPLSTVEEQLGAKRVAYLSDAGHRASPFLHSAEIANRGWVSLLSAPMRVESKLVGLMDVYTYNPRTFREWEKEALCELANQVALSIQRSEDLIRREKFEKLNAIIQEMTQTHDLDALLSLILDRASELVRFEKGWVSRLVPETGHLVILNYRGTKIPLTSLEPGRGITGKALRDGKPVRAVDVRSEEWRGIYEACWTETRSELAIPILLIKVPIRQGKEIRFERKLIGVLNLESDEVGSFSPADEELLGVLATQAGILIDRFEYEMKSMYVTEIEKKLAGSKDWDEIMTVILHTITTSLSYEYVNISLVIPELNLIRTEYVQGLPDEVTEFKKMASHTLDTNDILAHVYRSGEIEVPNSDDPRLDSAIVEKFGHRRLVRVFVPMKSTDDRVIGTVEAGYWRTENRPYIFEADVQVLQRFVSFAARILELRERRTLDRFGHELRQPLVGIQNNTSFLQRRWGELDKEKISRKLDDTMLDCTILLHQVEELEYVLGRPAPESKRERTVVVRDVIIKTIKQLIPLLTAQGFDHERVRYQNRDIHRIVLFVDRAKLNQVAYNIINNAIKYAEDEPDKFAIRIDIDETQSDFIVRFRDWGIGIRPDLVERVFEHGFRAAEALAKNVAGSGLGLTIARIAVRQLGGELRLTRHRKPTEFQLILPKTLKEMPNNGTRD